MKTRIIQNSLLAVTIVAALTFTTGPVSAQDSTATAATSGANVAPATAAPKLSYGVPQILQLAQAKVSDGIIVQYIQNSGTIYTPTASEIIYLHQQGVSDIVLNAMLDQRRRLAGSTEPTLPAPAGSSAAQTAATTAAQPPVAYVESAPAYTPSSTVYVIPDTQTYDYETYYYQQPYYYPYVNYPFVGSYYDYGWSYPSVSFSLGYAGGWGGYSHPGYHGGVPVGSRPGFGGGSHPGPGGGFQGGGSRGGSSGGFRGGGSRGGSGGGFQGGGSRGGSRGGSGGGSRGGGSRGR